MASSPITSCQVQGEKVVTVTDFIFFGSKITVDIDCSHEIKKKKKKRKKDCFLLEKKPMINRVLKSRDITLLTKICVIKAVFSSNHVWM